MSNINSDNKSTIHHDSLRSSLTRNSSRFPMIANADSIEVDDISIPPPMRPPRSPAQHSNHNVSGEGDDDTSSVAFLQNDEATFFVQRPKLERTESFMRRRGKKREKQQQLWQQKHGYADDDDNNGKGKNKLYTSEEDEDSEEIQDEEEMLRRSSNHGKFGVLPSSLSISAHNGGCSCHSYRRDELIREIDAASQKGYGAILKTLRDAGVLVYIIDAKVCITLHEMVDSVRQVIENVCRDSEYRDHPKNQKCLLYRDVDGRLFNLTFTSEFTSLSATWTDLLHSFSIVQALILLTFLTRSFSCGVDDELQDFRPAYLALVLGLVFSEEIGLSWTNVALLVRGIPSISAYSLVSKFGSDWPRKILILLLAVASYTTSTFQKVCTLGGVSLTCLVVLANLGSRSWKYLHWNPTMGMRSWCCGICKPFDPILAYVAAVVMGICFPYLGHRQVQSGGAAAIESVLRIALIVAGLFILSDWDEIQKFLVVGSESCNQDYVNFAVGGWWGFSLIASLTMLLRKEIHKNKKNHGNNTGCLLPNDEEPLLQEEQASPVGYKVPHLPEFPVDPSLTYEGWAPFCCWSVGVEYIVGVLVALGVGGFICYLGITDLDDQILANAF
ncbi:MAG: hypothetical protein SGILL_009520 [Bacillariaceae sp.]